MIGTLNSRELYTLNKKRLSLLQNNPLPTLSNFKVHAVEAANLGHFISTHTTRCLDQEGLLLIQLDEVISNEVFVQAFSELGELIPEYCADHAIDPYIELEYVLNIKTNHTENHTTTRPFTKIISRCTQNVVGVLWKSNPATSCLCAVK